MYDAFSESYDLFVNWPNRLNYELPFIEKKLNQLEIRPGRPGQVLDAACGTGRHAIALAQRGWQVTGSDFSIGMVAQAQRSAQHTNAGVQFFQAGFGEISSKSKSILSPSQDTAFDAVLCLGNSLPHLLDAPSLQAALVDFAACLAPGGLVFLQNRNFDLVMQEQQRWMEPQSQIDGNEEWLFLRFYDFLPNGLINFNILSLQRSTNTSWQQQVHTTQLRPLLQAELTAALKTAGFKQITLYGDMQGSPYNPEHSGNLIATAIKG